MREIKFRAWDKHVGEMNYCDPLHIGNYLCDQDNVMMQFTGLHDKNGDADIYECDIIDSNGNKKGNIYEMDAGETDLVIQDFGGKDWCSTYKEAMARGCKHA